MSQFIEEFYQSKNKIYFVIKYKGKIAAALAFFTLLFGTVGYCDCHSFKGFIESIMKAFSLFGLNFPDRSELNLGTIIGSGFAILTVTLTAILFFFKEQINQKLFLKISNSEHIGVFGLGQISRTFLDDASLDRNVVIIEQNDTHAEEYRLRGFGVEIGNAFNKDFLEKKINFKTMEYALIAFGDDKQNIEFAKKVISIYKAQSINTPIKLIVHINDKNLSMLFSKSFMLKNINSAMQINIKTFSYNEECARDLFSKYSIDGDTMEYMERGKPLETILLGDDDLIKRVVYKIIALSNFPNQNQHTIYVVNKDASALLEKIKVYIHYGEDNGREKFPTIRLVAVDIQRDKEEFFGHHIWTLRRNVENVIVCYDDESINIEIGTILHNNVYLADTVDKKKIPKVIIGVYDELELSDAINADKDEYRNMFTFGSKKDVVNQDHLINESIDNIAKLIHYGYGDRYKLVYDEVKQSKIEEKWFKSANYNDKLSNISQARHIDVKLKALGLKREVSTYSKDLLVECNRKMINIALINRGMYTDKNISNNFFDELKKSWDDNTYTVSYFKKEATSLFEKMIRMEHDRWNAHHYLEGWKYSYVYDKIPSKAKKEHHCLIPLEDFNKPEIKSTILYDIYSFLNLSNYLAQTGYKIVNYHNVRTVGITGHRKLEHTLEITNIVNEELLKLQQDGVKYEVISPLAEGADRLVAISAINTLGAKLVVPLPFTQEEYEKDFQEKGSIEEFRNIMKNAEIKPLELCSYYKNREKPLYDYLRASLYEEVGKFVVDNCEVLFVIWNGVEAKAKGGTADIYKYAQEQCKSIVYINSDTLEVKYIL